MTDHSGGEDGTGPLRAAVVGRGLGELVWADADGTPRASVVVPLWHDGAPWVAATYAELGTALAVAAAGEVVLALTHAGTAAPGAPALLVRARAHLRHDPTGERFVETLLDQELRTHPPSRALADSVLLRREHWWFVPRLLLRLEPVTGGGAPAVEGLDPVRDPRTAAVLATTPAGAGRFPEVRVVERPTADGTLRVPGAADAPALLLSHDASTDLERRTEQRVPGRLEGGVLVPAPGHEAGVAEPGPLPGPLTLLGRWRRQRALERACVAGLRRAGLH